jgi:hypothetical protein
MTDTMTSKNIDLSSWHILYNFEMNELESIWKTAVMS